MVDRCVDGVPQCLVFGGVYLCVPVPTGAVASHTFEYAHDRASAQLTTTWIDLCWPKKPGLKAV